MKKRTQTKDPIKVLLGKRKATKRKHAKEEGISPKELHWVNGNLLHKSTGKKVTGSPKLVNTFK